jgi:cell division protein ZapA (FtsZ GTPase activity inhibitor)
LKAKAKMKTNSYKLSIFGEHYCVISDESPEAVHKAALLVNGIMKEIASKAAHVEEKRIAILTALQMASKIISLESVITDMHQRQARLVDRMEHECLAPLRHSKETE